MSPAAAKPQGLAVAPSIPLELVEWKIDSNPQLRNGVNMCRFVPYVDARDVARLLDEWVGPSNWSDAMHGGAYDEATVAGEHGMWCSIAVRDPATSEWIVKTDFGKPSNVEKGKGLISDAFKRCAVVKWGVARNVYDLPNVTAPVNVWTPQGGGKTKAFVNDQTLPHILAELKRKGIGDVKGGRVEEHDDIEHQQQVEDDVSPHADQPAASRSARQSSFRSKRGKDAGSSEVPASKGEWPKTLPGIKGEIVKRLNALEPDTLKMVAKQAWMKAFKVQPTELKAADVQRAQAFVEAVEQCKSVVDVAQAGVAAGAEAESEPEQAKPPERDLYGETLTTMLSLGIADLSNDQLAAELKGAELPEPTEHAEAQRILFDHLWPLVQGEFDRSEWPEGPSQGEFDEWWNGTPEE